MTPLACQALQSFGPVGGAGNGCLPSVDETQQGQQLTALDMATQLHCDLRPARLACLFLAISAGSYSCRQDCLQPARYV